MWRCAYAVRAQIYRSKDFNLESRRGLYMTCIRGGANYGQELWAGQSGPDANQLLKDEYQILKMLIGSYRRPHRAAVRWLMRLLPLDSVAAIQQLKFIRNIRRGRR